MTATVNFLHSNADIDIFLQDAVSVLNSSTSATNQETVTFIAPSAGTFYLRLSPYGATAPSGVTYSLSTSFVLPCRLLYSNQAKSSAISMTAPSSLDSILCSQTQFDWYRISVNSSGYVNFTALFSYATGDIDMRLETESGTVLATAIASTNNEILYYGLFDPGNYYLRVRVAAGSIPYTGQPYRLSVTFQAGVVPPPPPPILPCDQIFKCADCTAQSNCGWCRDSISCLDGGAGGPVGSSYTCYLWVTGPDSDCSALAAAERTSSPLLPLLTLCVVVWQLLSSAL
jgi:hypothetical protein